jgi:hypothetical protein
MNAKIYVIFQSMVGQKPRKECELCLKRTFHRRRWRCYLLKPTMRYPSKYQLIVDMAMNAQKSVVARNADTFY